MGKRDPIASEFETEAAALNSTERDIPHEEVMAEIKGIQLRSAR